MDPGQENRLIKWIAGGSVLLMLLLLALAYDGLSRYKAESEAVRRSSLIIKRTEALFSVVKDAETGCRGYLLTNDTSYLEPYLQARQDLDGLVNELLVLLPDTDGVAHPMGLRVSINTMMTDLRQLIFQQRMGRAPQGRPDPALLEQAHRRMQALRSIHADLMGRHSGALRQRTEQEHALGLVTPMMILLYALLALALIALLFFRILRTLERVQRTEREARRLADERDTEARTRELAERRLKRVLDSAISGIMAFRAVRDDAGGIKDLECTMLNATAGKILGLGAEAGVGNTLLASLPGMAGNGLFEALEATVESGEAMTGEFTLEREGTKRLLVCSAVRLLDGLVVTFNDITEQRAQLRLLQESQRLAVTGKFARVVAHEVRNPLTNIQLALEQMEVESPVADDDPIRTYRDVLARNAGRIGALITQMLHSSRPMDVKLEPGPINAVLGHVLDLVKDRCALLGMRCETGLGEDLPFVRMDRELITIALVNLCVNAIEAMEEGRGALRIESRQVGDSVRVLVSDNGKGLGEEDRERIFQPFFSGRKGGMGLGLTEARNIFNAHGALLSLESEPGKGTTFIIDLPALG